MPGRDGTGPFGECFGGRGLGNCLRGRKAQGFNNRFLNRYGYQCGDPTTSYKQQSSFESLQARRDWLKMELDEIEKQIENK